MNVTDQTHPSPEDLAAYLAGKLNAVESDQIKEHLGACEPCCDLLDSLPTDDTIVAALRQTDVETAVSTDAELAKEIAPTIAPEAVEGTQAVRSQTTQIPGLDTDQLNLPSELREHPRYRIVELLGHGGMGDVYRAEHKKKFSVQLRDLKSGRLVKTLETAEFELTQATPEMPISVCFLTGDELVAVGYMHGEIRAFEIESGRLVVRKTGVLRAPNLVALGHGRIASTGLSLEGEDNDIRVWRLPESVWPKEEEE